jgi:flagellar FliJ protein
MTSSALETLIELATAASDEAAQRLGRAVSAAADADKKLELLVQYRDEYGERFNQSLRQGLSPSGYQNFRNFMDKLDAAIASQQKTVAQAKVMVDNERGQLQACEKKRLSYDALASRAQKQIEQREQKRDQKQMDEFASRALLHRR